MFMPARACPTCVAFCRILLSGGSREGATDTQKEYTKRIKRDIKKSRVGGQSSCLGPLLLSLLLLLLGFAALSCSVTKRISALPICTNASSNPCGRSKCERKTQWETTAISGSGLRAPHGPRT